MLYVLTSIKDTEVLFLYLSVLDLVSTVTW